MDLLFGCLLDWGLPLSMPHTHEIIDSATVHTYNDGDLIACFADKVSDTVVSQTPAAPRRVPRFVVHEFAGEN
jgi:adenine-specific DNA-methyltransferase